MKESNASSQPPHYTGHRHRLKEKFLKGSLLEDYELLELLLFHAIPRADVKPLAKDLVKRFSTFAQLLSSDPSLLKEIKVPRGASFYAVWGQSVYLFAGKHIWINR